MEADNVIARMRALGEGATARPWHRYRDRVRDESGSDIASVFDGDGVIWNTPLEDETCRNDHRLITTSANLHDLVWGAGGLVEAVDAFLSGHRPFAAYDRMNSALTALIAAAGEDA